MSFCYNLPSPYYLERQAHKVAYIHVGEGGERDLEDHLRGSRRVNLQILSTERLPDIDASDVIHGLDSSGTSRDYVDEGHRCTVSCPVGCQGHLRWASKLHCVLLTIVQCCLDVYRPNEIVIYESTRYNGRLFERKRTKGRFVTGGAGDDVVVSLDMTDFRRIGGGGRGVRRRREEAAPVHRAEVDRPERAERRPARCRRQDVVERLRERRFNLRFRDGATAVTTNPAPAPSPPLQLGTAAGLTQRLATLLDSAAVSREVAERHTWSPSDKSFNIVMKADDPTVMRRQPVAQSTDCIRGRVGYTQGVHMWEVRINLHIMYLIVYLQYFSSAGDLARPAARHPRGAGGGDTRGAAARGGLPEPGGRQRPELGLGPRQTQGLPQQHQRHQAAALPGPAHASEPVV